MQRGRRAPDPQRGQPAARLLTRPGEAIYNDANGLVEGNNFFQVVWLSDDAARSTCARSATWPRQRHRPAGRADRLRGEPARGRWRKNHLLGRLLQATGWPEPPKADHAWLGEAVAIKDPTAAVFRPQSGGNLLIVGQNDEAALGHDDARLVISLAAQHAPATRHRGSGGPVLPPRRQPRRLAPRREARPARPTCSRTRVQDVDLARARPGVITELAAEVERRQKADAGRGPEHLPVRLRPPAVPRPPQAGRRLRLLAATARRSRSPPRSCFATILRDGPPWASTRSSGATASTT